MQFTKPPQRNPQIIINYISLILLLKEYHQTKVSINLGKMEPFKTKRHFKQIRQRKPQHISKKIVDKLTYNPGIHKQQKTRNLRKKLQQRTLPLNPPPPPPPQTIKFGSINVNGLDVEAAWAVEKLLKDRKFDVSLLHLNIHKKIHFKI